MTNAGGEWVTKRTRCWKKRPLRMIQLRSVGDTRFRFTMLRWGARNSSLVVEYHLETVPRASVEKVSKILIDVDGRCWRTTANWRSLLWQLGRDAVAHKIICPRYCLRSSILFLLVLYYVFFLLDSLSSRSPQSGGLLCCRDRHNSHSRERLPVVFYSERSVSFCMFQKTGKV